MFVIINYCQNRIDKPRSLVVSDLRSETIGSRFKSVCFLLKLWKHFTSMSCFNSSLQVHHDFYMPEVYLPGLHRDSAYFASPSKTLHFLLWFETILSF